MYLDDDDAIVVDIYYMIRPRCLGEGDLLLKFAISEDFICSSVAISRRKGHRKGINADLVNTFAEWFLARFAWVTGSLINEEDKWVSSVRCKWIAEPFEKFRRLLV